MVCLLKTFVMAFVAITATAQSLTETVPASLTTTTTATSQTWSLVSTFAIPEGAMPPKATSTPSGQPDGNNNATAAGGASCSGRSMPNDNFMSINQAIATMDARCPGYTIPWRTGAIFYAEVYQAQIYICNYSFHDMACDYAWYHLSGERIDWSCGQGGGGWVTWADGDFTVGRDPGFEEHARIPVRECGWN